MDFLTHYGLFFAQTLTMVLAILAVVAGSVALISKDKTGAKSKLTLKKLNQKLKKVREQVQRETLSKKDFKKLQKTQKQQHKADAKEKNTRKKIFLIRFNGDIKATAVDSLREEVTAILTTATPKDEVVVVLESPGGVVHGYGLAASQLQRIKEKKIPLTVCVDKVAASGGYLMACVADRIFAAPFAIIGSIGVIAQMPNFNRFLKKHAIDFEQLTAGEYKRTLTLFGENTDKARHKFKADLEIIHDVFKNFVATYRPQVDLSKVATGEHWLATQAFDLRLVDVLKTSDDYLLEACEKADIYHVEYKTRKSLVEKVAGMTHAATAKMASPRGFEPLLLP